MKPSIFDYERREPRHARERRERILSAAVLVIQVAVIAGIIGTLMEWAIIDPTFHL